MTYEVPTGYSIYEAANQAVHLAYCELEEVSFEFNEIPLRATGLSKPDDIVEIYALKCEIRRLKK